MLSATPYLPPYAPPILHHPLPMTPRSSPRARAREIYRQMAEARAARTPLPDPPPQGGREKEKQGCGGQGLPAQNLTEKVRALYEHAAVPVSEIAKLAGVTERTIYKYARQHGWTPRYRWRAAAAGAGGKRKRGWRQRAPFAPLKGAGGRFVRRADAGKPHAVGLHATDPAGAARANAACRRAAALARKAQARAAVERREAAQLRALEAMNRTLADLNRYRASCAKAGQPGLRDDDRVAHLLMRTVEIATENWVRMLGAAREASCLPSPLVGEGGECGAIASTSRVRGYKLS